MDKRPIMRQKRIREEEYEQNNPYQGTPCIDEVVLNERETPKYLQPLDLGLRSTDEAARSPLIVTCRLKALNNHRVVSKERLEKKKQAKAECKEQKDAKRTRR